jgi:hypothetical protein
VWLLLTIPLRWLTEQLLLALFFFGVVTPLGLIFRLLARDVLALRPSGGRQTYWVPRPAPRDWRDYLRAF